MKKVPPPSYAQVRALWYLYGPPVLPATNARIDLAIRRTGNHYGLTSAGVPYIAPEVGMRARISCGRCCRWEEAEIMEVGKPHCSKHGDPECKLITPCGRRIYLFQTAMNGYSVTKPPTIRRQPRTDRYRNA